MDVNELRDDCRAYLKAKRFQRKVAQKLGVSYSWLNKFINGQFDDLRAKRLNAIAEWVAQDRAAARELEQCDSSEGSSQRAADRTHAYTLAGHQ